MLNRGDRPIRWTPHAAARLGLRAISLAEAEAVLNHPERVVPGRTPDRRVYMRRIHDSKINREVLVLLVVEETSTERVVVTAYLTTRPDRYLRGQP